MAKPKFELFFEMMLTQNKELFEQFKKIHALYEKDPKTNQAEFNNIGRDVQDAVRIYENRLCNSSESSGFGKFSTKLSEKFQAEVKKAFPKYDFIGAE